MTTVRFSDLPSSETNANAVYGYPELYVCENAGSNAYRFESYVTLVAGGGKNPGDWVTGITAKSLGNISEDGVTITDTQEGNADFKNAKGTIVASITGTPKSEVGFTLIEMKDNTIFNFLRDGRTTNYQYFIKQYTSNDSTSKPIFWYFPMGKISPERTFNTKYNELASAQNLKITLETPSADTGATPTRWVDGFAWERWVYVGSAYVRGDES